MYVVKAAKTMFVRKIRTLNIDEIDNMWTAAVACSFQSQIMTFEGDVMI